MYYNSMIQLIKSIYIAHFNNSVIHNARLDIEIIL